MNSGRREYTFFWFIENFSYCWHKHGEKLISFPFTAGGLEGTAWSLHLYPRGLRDEDRGFISLFLNRSSEDDGPEYVTLTYELSVLVEDGSPLFSVEYGDAFKKGDGRGRGKFLDTCEVLLRRKADCLPQDILTVRCKIWQGEGLLHIAAPICVRTRIGVEKISFMQVVENFSRLELNQKHVIDIPFPLKKECSALSSLYFTDDPRFGEVMIVEITSSDSNHILSKRKVSLFGCRSIVLCAEDDNRHDVARRDIGKLHLCLTRQTILNKRREYLPDGKLSLFCEYVFSTGLEFEKNDEILLNMSLPVVKQKSNHVSRTNVDIAEEKLSTYPSVSDDIKSLYINNSLTDVLLKTETKSFPAHRIVLCVRSPVFKAMMINEVEEKNTDCILIDDLRDDDVQQLLHFLYWDTVENFQWDIATRLYYAADKYQVDVLKEVCSSFLVENLTPSNAGELLLLADTYNDCNLKKLVEDFILEHEEQVFSSDKWEMLLETNPLLVMKTMLSKYKRKRD